MSRRFQSADALLLSVLEQGAPRPVDVLGAPSRETCRSTVSSSPGPTSVTGPSTEGDSPGCVSAKPSCVKMASVRGLRPGSTSRSMSPAGPARPTDRHRCWGWLFSHGPAHGLRPWADDRPEGRLMRDVARGMTDAAPTTARTVADLAELEGTWRRLEPLPTGLTAFQTWGWVMAWWQTTGCRRPASRCCHRGAARRQHDRSVVPGAFPAGCRGPGVRVAHARGPGPGRRRTVDDG